MENLLTYKRRAIEHVLQVEASQKPSRVVSPEEMLQGWVLGAGGEGGWGTAGHPGRNPLRPREDSSHP